MQRGFVSTLIILALAILAIGGGIYFGKNIQMPAVVPAKPETVTPVATTSPATSSQASLIVDVNADINLSISDNSLSLKKEGRVEQTIDLSSDAVDALKVLPLGIVKFITDQDANFDGHNDLAVFKSTGYAGVNMMYDYYIYNSREGKFEKSPILVDISNPVIDPVKKQIKSNYRSGPQWYTDTYEFDGETFIKVGESVKN